jgi:hypothetical protein
VHEHVISGCHPTAYVTLLLTGFADQEGQSQLALLSLFHLENHVCLSCGVHVVGATCRAAIRIVAGVGDLVQRTGDGRTSRVLGGRVVERSGGAVCGLHRARGDEEHMFLG